MDIDLKMCGAQLVRQVMKKHGHTMIYNNIYKTGTRTVKCYRPRSRQEMENLIFDIEHALSYVPVKYVIKITQGCRGYGMPGLIVKFPHDKFTKIRLAARAIAYHPEPLDEQVIEEILRDHFAKQK